MKHLYNTLFAIITLGFATSCSDDPPTPAEQLEIDGNQIDQYLTEKGLTATIDPSGLRIVFTETNNDVKPTPGDIVVVDYRGFFLNGEVFDTSYEQVALDNNIFNPQRTYAPIEFPIGQGFVIEGWEIGILQLGKGDKATLFLPSGLGYGSQGAGSTIGPNTIIAFDIVLVDIK